METTSNPIFIAEIKTVSPFGFGYKSQFTFVEQMEYAIHYGDWISVHDNALWGGDYDTISFVRNYTNKPILAKGIHGSDESIRMALEHGANYVLVVNRIPKDFSLYNRCLFEWNDYNSFLREFDYNSSILCDKHVYNSRDLRTGHKKNIDELDKFINHRTSQFLNKMWVCQASNIRTMKDVKDGVSAFIVGTHLREFCQTL